jgi:hypothetical protein
LSDAIAPRADEYALHPVLFDGALQVFLGRRGDGRRSTGADEVAGAFWPHSLPWVALALSVAFAPRFATLAMIFSKATSAIYDERGKPCVLVMASGPSAFPARAAPPLPGGRRDLTYHVAWQRTPNESAEQVLPPLPLGQLHSAAQSALDEIVALRGLRRTGGSASRSRRSRRCQLARGLRDAGINPNASFDAGDTPGDDSNATRV